jgi:predicted dehydrogenase
MVMNAEQARGLVDCANKTGKTLVVGFQGGLSPAIRKASQLLRSGACGDLLNINGMIWQNWGPKNVGKWRQDLSVSGGGFMFDTGAHMLNSVCDLAGEDFVEVAAWQNNLGRPVDILSAIMGRLKSGGLVNITGCGETVPSCASELWVFCTEAIIRTGQWGERLEIQRHREEGFQPVTLPPMNGTWGQFVKVLSGDIPNPCPPEVGLRMAKLWDAVRLSAENGGRPVDCREL